MITVLLANVLPWNAHCRGRMRYPGYRATSVDTAIYLAHLSALTGLCASDEKYGLVLENDVEPVGDWPMTLEKLAQSNDVALTILAPSVIRHQYMLPFMNNHYTVVEPGDVWGAGAYLYNLRLACRRVKEITLNMGCVPFDFAAPSLLSHVTATVPWYVYKSNPNGSHKDETQMNLESLSTWATRCWKAKQYYKLS